MTIDSLVPELLVAAFEHDIQSESIAKHLCEMVTSGSDGTNRPSTFQGNSCSVIINGYTVRIQNDLSEDDEALEMSIEQYRVLLDAWIAQLSA
jgi:hypothetical protein